MELNENCSNKVYGNTKSNQNKQNRKIQRHRFQLRPHTNLLEKHNSVPAFIQGKFKPDQHFLCCTSMYEGLIFNCTLRVTM